MVEIANSYGNGYFRLTMVRIVVTVIQTVSWGRENFWSNFETPLL